MDFTGCQKKNLFNFFVFHHPEDCSVEGIAGEVQFCSTMHCRETYFGSVLLLRCVLKKRDVRLCAGWRCLRLGA
jgi:hypothetical protein